MNLKFDTSRLLLSAAVGLFASSTALACNASPSCTGDTCCGYREPAKLFAVPTYHSMSIYWRPNSAPTGKPVDLGCKVRYRKAGDANWSMGHKLYWDSPKQNSNVGLYYGSQTYSNLNLRGQCRGSLVNLRPGQQYNVEVKLASQADSYYTEIPLAYTKTRSNPSETPQYSSTGNVSATLDINSGGSATNYKVYNGSNYNYSNANEDKPCINVNASYVILRNFNLNNCAGNGILIAADKHDVIIENSTITNWGGEFHHQPGGTTFKQYKNFYSDCENGTTIKQGGTVGVQTIGRTDQAAIKVGARVARLTVQNNVIHSPRHRSVYWNECKKWGHPNGPRGIKFARPETESNWAAAHVIRFNRFYGASASTRNFEDIISAGNNGHANGAIGPDSDIYGNFFQYATDDIIELDGGGQNIRVFGNYFDAATTPLSLQSVPIGPVYVFRNVINRGRFTTVKGLQCIKDPSDSRKTICSQTVSSNLFKTKNYDKNNDGVMDVFFNGPLYVFHNTSLLSGTNGFETAFSVGDQRFHRVMARNNVFMTQEAYGRHEASGSFDYYSSFGSETYNKACTGGFSMLSTPGSNYTAVTWDAGNTLPSNSSSTGKFLPSTTYRYNGVNLSNFNDSVSIQRGAHSSGWTSMTMGTSSTMSWPP